MTNLVEEVSKAYGIDLVELRETDGGLDADARTFEGIARTGERFFLKTKTKLSPGIALSAALNAAGIEAVLAPIPARDGQIAHRANGKFLLAYPFKEGHNGFQKPLQPGQWRQIGQALRRIHDSDLPEAVLSQVDQETFTVEGVPEFQAAMANPTDALLTDVLQSNSEAIDRIVQRTAVLGQACQARQWSRVPCHADIHVGNVLVEPSDFVNLIDWDTPRRAPRECDLIFFCGGGITGHGDQEERSFFEGYGPFEPDLLAMTYYRYARALEDIVAFTREAIEGDKEAVRWLNGLFGPNQIVETSFCSDDRLNIR